MTDEVSRLVLRRNCHERTNKIAVRLADNVDRNGNLYELLSEGLVIEVIDIEDIGDDRPMRVTLGINAPKEFRVDRVEKLQSPRTNLEIGAERFVRFSVMTAKEIEALTLEEVDAKLAEGREAERALRAQLARLKRDKSKASDQGIRRPKNKKHHEWLMLIEEIDIVTEQVQSAHNSVEQLQDAQKTKRHALAQMKRVAFQDHFVRLAQEKMGEKAYEKLRSEAQQLADGVGAAA
jgi:hypothetical protein